MCSAKGSHTFQSVPGFNGRLQTNYEFHMVLTFWDKSGRCCCAGTSKEVLGQTAAAAGRVRVILRVSVSRSTLPGTYEYARSHIWAHSFLAFWASVGLVGKDPGPCVVVKAALGIVLGGGTLAKTRGGA